MPYAAFYDAYIFGGHGKTGSDRKSKNCNAGKKRKAAGPVQRLYFLLQKCPFPIISKIAKLYNLA